MRVDNKSLHCPNPIYANVNGFLRDEEFTQHNPINKRGGINHMRALCRECANGIRLKRNREGNGQKETATSSQQAEAREAAEDSNPEPNKEDTNDPHVGDKRTAPEHAPGTNIDDGIPEIDDHTLAGIERIQKTAKARDHIIRKEEKDKASGTPKVSPTTRGADHTNDGNLTIPEHLSTQEKETREHVTAYHQNVLQPPQLNTPNYPKHQKVQLNRAKEELKTRIWNNLTNTRT
jgi:hypothetical protein